MSLSDHQLSAQDISGLEQYLEIQAWLEHASVSQIQKAVSAAAGARLDDLGLAIKALIQRSRPGLALYFSEFVPAPTLASVAQAHPELQDVIEQLGGPEVASTAQARLCIAGSKLLTRLQGEQDLMPNHRELLHDELVASCTPAAMDQAGPLFHLRKSRADA